MGGRVKEWGALVELCLVVAGFPLSVLAPQVLWQVFGERQAVGALTLLAQFLGAAWLLWRSCWWTPCWTPCSSR